MALARHRAPRLKSPVSGRGHGPAAAPGAPSARRADRGQPGGRNGPRRDPLPPTPPQPRTARSSPGWHSPPRLETRSGPTAVQPSRGWNARRSVRPWRGPSRLRRRTRHRVGMIIRNGSAIVSLFRRSPEGTGVAPSSHGPLADLPDAEGGNATGMHLHPAAAAHRAARWPVENAPKPGRVTRFPATSAACICVYVNNLRSASYAENRRRTADADPSRSVARLRSGLADPAAGPLPPHLRRSPEGIKILYRKRIIDPEAINPSPSSAPVSSSASCLSNGQAEAPTYLGRESPANTSCMYVQADV